MNGKTFILLVILILFGLFFFTGNEDNPSEIEAVSDEIVETQSEEVEEESLENTSAMSPAEEIKKVQPSAPQTSQSPRAKYPNLDDSFIPFDEEGNRYVTQVVQNGKHLVYHGDVLVGDSKDLQKLMKKGFIKRGKSKKWHGGKIPYVIDSNVQQEDKVIEAIEYLNTFTNINIVPREDEEDYVLVTLGESDCYAYAGKIGGMQEIFLVPACGVREILHEWMHTMGFFHEQNREDRDQYLKVHWDNIDEVNHPQFKKLPNDFIGLVGRPFDYQSIMLYHSFTFSLDPNEPAMVTKDGEVISPSKNLLSDEDIVRVNRAYPKNY